MHNAHRKGKNIPAQSYMMSVQDQIVKSLLSRKETTLQMNYQRKETKHHKKRR